MINKWLWGLVLGWLMMGLPLFVSAMPAKITAIQVSNIISPTQITIKLSAPGQPHIFTLAHPDRLVLDFSDTQLAVKLKALHWVNPNIKSIRSGRPKAAVLRLVFDISHSFHFKTLTKLPAREIVVTLSTSTAMINTKKIKSVMQEQSSSSNNVAHDKVVTLKKTLSAQTSAKTISTANKHGSVAKNEAPVSPPSHLLIVMIDPGHGGRDTGAIGDLGTKEKEVVLKIAKQLAALINQEPNMYAVLTRDGDYYVTLHNRLVYARQHKADIYISIHADSYFNNRASGASVYALSKHGATSIAARWLAKRDNYSELEGVALSELSDQSPLLRSVLIDLAQTATVTDSMRLGTALLDALDNVTTLHYSRVEQAPFMVLKSPDIPSILVETGFISNSAEELRLRDKSYQHKIAVALFNGIRYYQKKYAVAGI